MGIHIECEKPSLGSQTPLPRTACVCVHALRILEQGIVNRVRAISQHEDCYQVISSQPVGGTSVLPLSSFNPFPQLSRSSSEGFFFNFRAASSTLDRHRDGVFFFFANCKKASKAATETNQHDHCKTTLRCMLLLPLINKLDKRVVDPWQAHKQIDGAIN